MSQQIPERITIRVSAPLRRFLEGGHEKEGFGGRIAALEDRYRVLVAALLPSWPDAYWFKLVDLIGDQNMGGRQSRKFAEALSQLVAVQASAAGEDVSDLLQALGDLALAQKVAVIDRIERLRSGQDLDTLDQPPLHGHSYPPEVRAQAKRLWVEEERPAAEIAKQLGVSVPLIYRWSQDENWAALRQAAQLLDCSPP